MKNNCFRQQFQSQIDQNSILRLSNLRKTQSVLFQQTVKNTVVKRIVVAAQNLNEQLKIYEWRNSISKGITKCKWNCILPIDKDKSIIQTQRKAYKITLKDLNKISLSQIFYILRQVMEGFEKLYKKFDSFLISEECINFDENYLIQVWISKQPSSNTYIKSDQTQHQFICSILNLFLKHQIKSNIGKEFYLGLQRFEEISFQRFRSYMQSFITRKQLIVGNQKSFKQVFCTPKSIKIICEQKQKNLQKSTSLNFIRFQNVQAKYQNVGLGLLFSPSKKGQRKRISIITPSSAKIIKQSDQTTLFTDREDLFNQLSSTKKSQSKLKMSIFTEEESHKKITNKNYKSLLGQDRKTLFQYRSQQGGDSSKSSFQNCQLEINLCDNWKRQKIKQDQLFEKVQPYSIPQLIFSEQSTYFGSKVNNLFAQTREALSQRTNEDVLDHQNSSSKNYKKILSQQIENKQYNLGMALKTYQSLQDPQMEENNQSVFKKYFQNTQLGEKFTFFENLNSIALTKQLKNSIQIGKQIKKLQTSPIKLQKLGKFKLQTYQSIIQDEFLIHDFNQTPTFH